MTMYFDYDAEVQDDANPWGGGRMGEVEIASPANLGQEMPVDDDDFDGGDDDAGAANDGNLRHGAGPWGSGEIGFNGNLAGKLEGVEIGDDAQGNRSGAILGEAGEDMVDADGEVHDQFGNLRYGAAGDMEEIGDDDDEAAAIMATIARARDNRRPAPRMHAWPADARLGADQRSECAAAVCLGAAMAAGGEDQFPLFSALLARAGAGMEPRIVRVDTEESYAAYRAAQSPETAELHDRLTTLEAALEEHIAAPHLADEETVDMASDAAEEYLGAAAAAMDEAAIDMWLPPAWRGKIHAWREGDMICCSVNLPGADGKLRICTAIEPREKSEEELARAAAEAGVPGSVIVGALPAMAECLGAGTIVKEIAAAAPAILARPEAAGPDPFMVRIEPKASPGLAALIALAAECRRGNDRACAEWRALGAAAAAGAPPLAQAMQEAAAMLRKVA